MSRKRYIVPGVHDPIPPNGRITVQLTHPTTGRVVKEVRSENAIMDWFTSQVSGFGRGDGYASSVADVRRYSIPNLSPNSMNIDVLQNRDPISVKFNIAGQYPGLYSAGTEVPFIWGSSANITPNAAHTHFPGSDAEGMVTGFARLDALYTSNPSNLPRGTVVPGESTHTHNQTRMVVEFTTAQGNGVYRSIGVGSVSQRSLAYSGGGAPHQTSLWYPDTVRSAANTGITGSTTYYAESEHYHSITWPDHRAFIVRSNTQDIRIHDFNVAATGAGTAGPSSATIGGSGRPSVATHGGKLWIGRGTTLKKCVYPTNTTLTVDNTYAPVTGFTDAAILDLTSDGTSLYLLGSTKVFVVDPATGAVTSSWTHSLPRTSVVNEVANIEWDPAMGHLWLAIEQYATAANGQTYPWGLHTALVNSGGPVNNYLSRSYAYTVSGTRLNYALPFDPAQTVRLIDTQADASGSSWDGNSSSVMRTGMTGIAQQHGWASLQSINAYFAASTSLQGTQLRGPSMASHTLLSSDVTKTGANGMKIIYEFDYTDV
jgi:hypothetical protein